MKIKSSHAAARVAVPAPPSEGKKSAAVAPQTLHVEKKRDEKQLQSERGGDWKGLAEVSSKGGVFGASGISALVERYGLDEPSMPAQKFMKSIAFIDESVRGSKDPEKVADAILNHDARREVFRLEGLLRFYSKDLKGSDGLLEFVKELEDHIGAVTSFDHALRAAGTHKAPQVVVDRITALKTAAREAVVGLLRDKWMPGKDGLSEPIAELGARVMKHDFGTPKEDRKNVAHKLAKQAEKLREGVSDLSMKDLDQGVHRMRRQLRWLALSMESVGGLVQPTKVEQPHAHYAAVREALTKPEYDDIMGEPTPPLPAGAKAIEVPDELDFALKRAIKQLGELKDDCEVHELLSSAYAETGMSANDIAKLLGTRGTPRDMTARASVIRDEFSANKMLKGLQKAFEEA